jgi:hypothetical protein
MNGYGKQIFIGVAIIVLGAVIIGAGSLTIANSMDLNTQTVKVEALEGHVADNTKKTDSIDVMQKQVDIIEKNVGKILDKLNR